MIAAMADKLALPGGLFLAALLVLVGVACWTDITRRKIPNWLCAATALLGITYVVVLQGPHGALLALAHMAAALVVTMGLFAVRFIGAGDAKFYAAMATWLPITDGVLLLVAVAICGFVLLLLFIATRLRGRARRSARESSDFDKLPYGVAIAVGGLTAIALS